MVSRKVPPPSGLIARLKEHAEAKLKHELRSLKQRKKDFLAKFGPQDAKPEPEVRAFEEAFLALKLKKHRLSEYGSDANIPCPICFAEGKANALSGSVRFDTWHCEVCGFIDA